MGSLGISNHREGHHPPLGGWAPRLGYVWDVGFHNHGDRCSSPKSWGCVIPPQPFMAEIYGLINGADCKHLHPLGQVWALPTVPHESWSSCIWHGIHPFFCIGFFGHFLENGPKKNFPKKNTSTSSSDGLGRRSLQSSPQMKISVLHCVCGCANLTPKMDLAIPYLSSKKVAVFSLLPCFSLMPFSYSKPFPGLSLPDREPLVWPRMLVIHLIRKESSIHLSHPQRITPVVVVGGLQRRWQLPGWLARSFSTNRRSCCGSPM